MESVRLAWIASAWLGIQAVRLRDLPGIAICLKLTNAASPVYLELIDLIVSRATPEGLLQFRPSEAN
jgi:hypothetical protein